MGGSLCWAIQTDRDEVVGYLLPISSFSVIACRSQEICSPFKLTSALKRGWVR